ncbi:conserved hypothetical protein [Formosa agariphila KMM 3901]|uniref:FAS1 domain-containing protein n=1 Tax=Formosa agariphila (strain DSM 15362 / KCTC 12365 / LMG 23005 / KMM 3901 / M-2Alg 35-1) TaxID=1347342 RepID=T2KP02_FORAG|nr:conserved hypothetical protein [Formosa agariphila KMM 3901]
MSDKTIYEYLLTDDYNWDLTVQMIEHAGLTDVFNGIDPNYPQVMFMGLTSHSIRKWIYTQNLESVSQTDPEVCRQILLNHLFEDVYLRDEIPLIQDGGVYITSIGGAEIQLFTEEDIDLIYGVGPVLVKFNSADGTSIRFAQIASADIHPSNGIVHSMHYDYIIDKL